MPQPNIFRVATKELSQDGFITWLLQWADEAHYNFHHELNLLAREFIRLLIGESYDYIIRTVKAGRQKFSIDVWAEINEDYFLGIEDKTNTLEHDDQMARYLQQATAYYQPRNREVKLVYLKTGNESSHTLDEKRLKYLVFGRRDILDLLNRYPVKNDILNDFKEYLEEIEYKSKFTNDYQLITNDIRAAEGFFLHLQNRITEHTQWGHVPNRRGGFLGFWYHERTIESYKIYIQLENSTKGSFKITVRLRGHSETQAESLQEVNRKFNKIIENFQLVVQKRSRLKTGESSTLAIVTYDLSRSNSFIDELLNLLNMLELVIDQLVLSVRNDNFLP